MSESCFKQFTTTIEIHILGMRHVLISEIHVPKAVVAFLSLYRIDHPLPFIIGMIRLAIALDHRLMAFRSVESKSPNWFR